MRKTILLLLITSVVFYACQSGENTKTKEDKNHDVSKQTEAVKKTTPEGIGAWPDSGAVVKGEQYTIEARFESFVPNSDGTVFIFRDNENNEFELWHEGGFSKGLDFAKSIEPNKHPAEYDDKWFEVSWEVRDYEMYDGYTGEYEKMLVGVVKNVKPINK